MTEWSNTFIMLCCIFYSCSWQHTSSTFISCQAFFYLIPRQTSSFAALCN